MRIIHNNVYDYVYKMSAKALKQESTREHLSRIYGDFHAYFQVI